MKEIYLYTIINILFVSMACKSQNLDSITKDIDSSGISKIEIIDRCGCSKFKKIEISNNVKINKITNEIKLLKKFEDHSPDILQPPVTNSRGFFEIILLERENKTRIIHLVYTTYDGVIFDINNKYYKNDNLEILIHEFIEQSLNE